MLAAVDNDGSSPARMGPLRVCGRARCHRKRTEPQKTEHCFQPAVPARIRHGRRAGAFAGNDDLQARLISLSSVHGRSCIVRHL